MGWIGPEELDETIAVFRARGYERIITAGGPVDAWPPVPAPAIGRDRTYSSAVAVREWAKRSGLRPAGRRSTLPG